MARSRQRRRDLARLKYQRQSLRRTAQQERQRKLAIAGGVIVALVGVAALVWLIVHLAKDDSSTPETPVTPSITLPTSGDTGLTTSPTTQPTTSPTTSSPTKSSPTKSSPTKSSPTNSSPTKSSPTKSSSTKASPTKAGGKGSNPGTPHHGHQSARP